MSPIHGVNAVDSSWDNPPILRQYWPAARRLKDGQTAAVGNGLGAAAGNILDITTVFVSLTSSPVLAPIPMHPVLHSSCSAPVPYVPGMTALEIDTSVRAGFPSPAEDFQAERIDVLKQTILHPQATYTLRVRGDSMRDEGIFDGDVILVDRAIKPRHGHIVVAVVDGAFTCKKLWLRGGKLKLMSANPDYPDIIPQEGQTIEVWGVVLACDKRFKI